MRLLLEALRKEPDFVKLSNAPETGKCPALVCGLSAVNRAHFAAALRAETGRPLVVVVSEETAARRIASDLAAFTGEDAAVVTARDFVFYNAETVSRERERERIAAMYGLLRGTNPITVVTVDGLMQRTLPPAMLEGACMTLRCGEEYSLDDVISKLTRAGYKRAEQVEGRGQFAVRGGILDFFSTSMDEPVRCEFFGDEIDSMGVFGTDTQRRHGNLEAADILPAWETAIQLVPDFTERLSELLRRVRRRKSSPPALAENIAADLERWQSSGTMAAADRYIGLTFDELCCFADYIPKNALVILDEPHSITERIKNYLWQLSEDAKVLIENGTIEGGQAVYSVDDGELFDKIADYPVVMADNFTHSKYPLKTKTLLNIEAKQLSGYGGSLETAVSDIRHYIRSGYSTFVLCGDAERAENMRGLLAETGIAVRLDLRLSSMPEAGEAVVGVGAVSAGMEYPQAKLALITEGQLMGGTPAKKRKRKEKSNRQRLNSYADLSPGDLVVHEYHGIGRFVGIFPIQNDGVTRDYIKIAYQGTDCLYVPATQLDLVSKYIGAGDDKPVKLSSLGGTDWARAKSRAKGAAKEMARELIALYAERQRREGFAFSPDSVWQTEFEDAFGYKETDDQLRCIAEIKEDMERPTPMDRLLCGDVGYGKTEVALRAAMKCILDGKQAAILVPTTVLAQQHSVTASKRFANYPVRIEVLSRFRTKEQIKQTIEDIKRGSVDLVIGTHRLIQKDIIFKDLGLLIVDEEQRFGVAHKERLKEMSRQVDVLTLSATPIPRTLNMALSGIRDMSVIEEPPEDRQPVQTYVLEHDWSIIGDAIRRELARGGQVYYMHNRIDSIERTAARVLSLCPEGTVVATAHGKMHEDELGEIMERMSSGEIQVLVCTTIIETGIDIPNVNTLIIEDADRLGLSQLHQIRGRVGRSSRHAFAYMTFRQGKTLTEDAGKRLAAIREFAEFNSGFRIAMRDLEIRGAGNLLGSEQSGHMISVGYDMYLKLLEEAVLEEQGKQPELRTECAADLAVNASIPEKYIQSPEQRMDAYRRIAGIRTEEDADDVTDELIDRYGDPPSGVNTLIHVALLRGMAGRAGITDISQKSGWVVFKFDGVEPERIARVCAEPKLKDRIKVEASDAPTIRMRIKSLRNVISEAVSFVEVYGGEKQTG